MDNSISWLRVRDDTTVDRAGQVTAVKVGTFYIGDHGPFTERVPADDNFDAELRRRAELLRVKLAGLPT